MKIITLAINSTLSKNENTNNFLFFNHQLFVFGAKHKFEYKEIY